MDEARVADQLAALSLSLAQQGRPADDAACESTVYEVPASAAESRQKACCIVVALIDEDGDFKTPLEHFACFFLYSAAFVSARRRYS